MVQLSHENMNLRNKNKFKPRVNYADTAINCDTFLLHHLAHVIVLWQMKKLCLTVPFCFILFRIWGQFPRINPRVLQSQGRLTEGFFVLWVCGAFNWKGLKRRGKFWPFWFCIAQIQNKHLLECVRMLTS